ncbi:MAG: GxxExxY protein [Clostridia bacterium]|nr:GxxExxY protein [Clostridia bacterium]
MEENTLTKTIIGAAIKVHRELGPGLLESVYRECLFYELNKTGLFVEKEKKLPVVYYDVIMEIGYRVDFLIEKQIIVEIKSVKSLTDIHTAQMLTYLKLNNNKLGLLINFNEKLLKDGIVRLINKYYLKE